MTPSRSRQPTASPSGEAPTSDRICRSLQLEPRPESSSVNTTSFVSDLSKYNRFLSRACSRRTSSLRPHLSPQQTNAATSQPDFRPCSDHHKVFPIRPTFHLFHCRIGRSSQTLVNIIIFNLETGAHIHVLNKRF